MIERGIGRAVKVHSQHSFRGSRSDLWKGKKIFLTGSGMQ